MLYPKCDGEGIGFVNQQFTMKHMYVVKMLLRK